MKQISSLLFIALLSGCFGASAEKTGLEGKPLPTFNLLLSDSITTFNTNRIPTGKPSVFFLFSPWCPYCRAQTKEILEGMDKLKDIQFYFVTNFPIPALKSFYKEYDLAKYSNITAGVDTAHFMHNYFEVTGVPYIAIYDKEKKLNSTFKGKIFISQLKKAAED